MKKTIETTFILLILSTTMMVAQSWQALDYRTPEGYAALQKQYEDDDLLPIDERLSFYKVGIQASRYHRDSTWLPQFAYQVASTANSLDSLNMALEYIAIARSTVGAGDDFVINIINYQGVLHKQSGDYEQALAYYEEALRIARDKYPDKEIMPLSNIATLYRSQKDYQKTLEYLYQLDEIAQELESPHREYHLVYNNAEFCIVHKNLNHLDSAAYYAQLCIQNLDKLEKKLNMKAVGFAYITVAEFYIEDLQQPERAKPLLDSALLYVEGLYLDKVKVSLGKYYLAKSAYAEAETVVRELNQTNIQAQTTRLRVLELSQQYYTTIKDFEKALAVANEIKELEADRFSEEKARLTTFYSAKFENQKRLEEIQKLQYRQHVKDLGYRTRILILLLLCLLILGIALFLKQQVSRKKKFADILQREVDVKTQDLKIANAELADKVEKLNTFNYTVSHDLKTPLSSAFNFIDLIKLHSWNLLNPHTLQQLDNLHGVLTHIKEMVNGVSLYLMADRMDLQPEIVSTEDIIHRTLSNLKHQYPDQLKQYELVIQSPLPDCQVDPYLFRQAITNLLNNAIKATQFTDTPQIQISGQAIGQTVMLTVRDNGIGIPLQAQKRLFELFKSVHTKDQFPGTGVGLAIVKRILERHGGTIEVESDGPGKGAAFYLSIPSLPTT